MLRTIRNSAARPARALFRAAPLPGLLFCLGLLLLACCLSVAIGSATLDPSALLRALLVSRPSGAADINAHDIVWNIRIPRTLLALCVGAGLGVAGALMQALSKNPLAAPNTMGVSAGASFLVVAVTFFLGITSLAAYTWFSLLGALIAGLLVYNLGSLGRRGMTPLKLILAGATITTLFTSLTQGLLVINESSLDEVRFWLAGSVGGRNINILMQGLPYLLPGLLLALLLGRQMTILSLGDDVARGLGLRVGLVKALAAAAIILLAGSAVAMAGPIGFVGLVIPHAARGLVRNDYRWVLPYSLVLGATLLLGSDVVARLVIRPNEIPVGAVTALIGAPVLIWLIRQKGVVLR
ncbi:MAG: iron ABC transporter permease [Ktedonobacteraceae bacterium]|nr:iron ABC transporter permease [Ktedonobacteraceae bacterium]